MNKQKVKFNKNNCKNLIYKKITTTKIINNTVIMKIIQMFNKNGKKVKIIKNIHKTKLKYTF
jgi:hypothetical protein